MGVAERFWAKVVKSGDCWHWTGARTMDGYGQFWFDGRLVRAHRFAYLLEVGEIPEGLVIHHRCHNGLCVRPDHLEAVQNQQHVSDHWAHEKARGYRRPCGRPSHKAWKELNA